MINKELGHFQGSRMMAGCEMGISYTYFRTFGRCWKLWEVGLSWRK
jgi:hypothetical protein